MMIKRFRSMSSYLSMIWQSSVVFLTRSLPPIFEWPSEPSPVTMPTLLMNGQPSPTTMSIVQQQLDRQAPLRSYGISRPISLDFPSPSDLSATRNLEETLRSYDYFESDAELAHRIDVLTKLNRLVRSWIRDVSLAKHFPREFIDNVGGSLVTFGSFRLGVHAKGKTRCSNKVLRASHSLSL